MSDKSSYLGRFKYNSAMTQVQLLASSPRTGAMTSQYMTSPLVTKSLHMYELIPLDLYHLNTFPQAEIFRNLSEDQET